MSIIVKDNLMIPLPDNSILQGVEYEPENNALVGYGIPNDTHDCDMTGCPTIGHVLFVKNLDR